MPSFTSKAAALAALSFANLALADGPAGMSDHLFPNSDCSLSGYYTQAQVQDYDHCLNEYLDDPNFSKADNGKYQIWYQAPSFTGDYQVIVQTPPQNPIPGNPCGYPAQMLKSGECQLVEVDDHWYINTCEGSQCPSVQGRRDLPPLTADDNARVIETVYNRTKPAGVHMSKRADCSFNPSSPNYQVVAGDLQRITEIYDNTAGEESSTVELSTSTTIGSTQSFGVSESTEAGLFDIVQETISFSYMYSYMQSRTVGSTRSFTFPAGQAGYGAFIPYYECASGNFGGSCNGIPTNQDGQACVPKFLNGDMNTQDGEYRTVQT